MCCFLCPAAWRSGVKHCSRLSVCLSVCLFYMCLQVKDMYQLHVLVTHHVQLHIHSAQLPATPVLMRHYCRQQWAASCGRLPPFWQPYSIYSRRQQWTASCGRLPPFCQPSSTCLYSLFIAIINCLLWMSRLCQGREVHVRCVQVPHDKCSWSESGWRSPGLYHHRWTYDHTVFKLGGRLAVSSTYRLQARWQTGSVVHILKEYVCRCSDQTSVCLTELLNLLQCRHLLSLHFRQPLRNKHTYVFFCLMPQQARLAGGGVMLFTCLFVRLSVRLSVSKQTCEHDTFENE